MTLPADWTQIPVTYTGTFADGTPAAGYPVRFTNSQILVVDGVQQIIPRTLIASLDATGSLPAGFTIPATDDPHLNILTSAYTVTIGIPGGPAPFSMFAPHNGGPINLSTVVPVVPPPSLVSTLGPVPLKPITPWVTAAAYIPGPPASFVSEGGSSYSCLIAHTSGDFATDLAAGKWGIVAAVGATGNVQFATFAIDPATGDLSITTPSGYTGPAFAIDASGNLGVTIA